MDLRMGRATWGKGQPRQRTSAAYWREPLKWDREASEKAQLFSGMPWFRHPVQPRPRVFCASLADWLDDEVPIEWLADLLDLIRRTPNLDWLLLTKRPQNWAGRIEKARRYASMDAPIADDTERERDRLSRHQLICWLLDWENGKPPANVWIGTSVEDQVRADERIPLLLQIPAKVRFLSMEPLLGAVTLPASMIMKQGGSVADGVAWHLFGIHWVIVGGESGPHARPMHPDWARSLRDQCKAAGVAFHFKQWGEWAGHYYPENGVVHVRKDGSLGDYPLVDSWSMKRVGKHAAGRLLDGVEHNCFPTSTP